MRIWLLVGLHACMTKEDLFDLDGDGYAGKADCRPRDAEVHPTPVDTANGEVDTALLEERAGANGVDDDCDGSVDEPFDKDGDGVLGEPDGEDCDDENPNVYPGATEIQRNGLDDDCDGEGTAWPASIDLDALSGDTDLAVQLLTSDGARGRLGWSVVALGDVAAAETDEQEQTETTGLHDLALGAPHLGDSGAICLITGESLRSSDASGSVGVRCDALGLDEESGTSMVGWGVAAGLFLDDEMSLVVSAGAGTGPADDIMLLDGYLSEPSGVIRVGYSPPEAGSDATLSREVLTGVGDLGGDTNEELYVAVIEGQADDRWVVGALYPGAINPGEQAPRLVVVDDNPGTGRAVSHPGDVDGDGLADLLVGLPDRGEGGVAYLVHGDNSMDDIAALDEELVLDEAELVMRGDAGWSLGWAVATGSDLDGDGADDLLIGAPGGRSSWDVAGGAVVVLAPVPGAGEYTPSDATVYYNPDEQVTAGTSVALPGDTDADGHADALAGSTHSGEGAGVEAPSVAWLLLDPSAAGAGAERPLIASSSIVSFTSAREASWEVFSAGDMDVVASEDAPRANGADFVITNQAESEVYLLWGRGM